MDPDCVYEEPQLASDRRRGESWLLDCVSTVTNVWPLSEVCVLFGGEVSVQQILSVKGLAT